jgi:hypothetical protein
VAHYTSNARTTCNASAVDEKRRKSPRIW